MHLCLIEGFLLIQTGKGKCEAKLHAELSGPPFHVTCSAAGCRHITQHIAGSGLKLETHDTFL
jgi:hypothetical protein